jgi:hypothetical protein
MLNILNLKLKFRRLMIKIKGKIPIKKRVNDPTRVFLNAIVNRERQSKSKDTNIAGDISINVQLNGSTLFQVFKSSNIGFDIEIDFYNIDNLDKLTDFLSSMFMEMRRLNYKFDGFNGTTRGTFSEAYYSLFYYKKNYKNKFLIKISPERFTNKSSNNKIIFNNLMNIIILQSSNLRNWRDSYIEDIIKWMKGSGKYNRLTQESDHRISVKKDFHNVGSMASYVNFEFEEGNDESVPRRRPEPEEMPGLVYDDDNSLERRRERVRRVTDSVYEDMGLRQVQTPPAFIESDRPRYRVVNPDPNSNAYQYFMLDDQEPDQEPDREPDED